MPLSRQAEQLISLQDKQALKTVKLKNVADKLYQFEAYLS